jgi:hypothetical protein
MQHELFKLSLGGRLNLAPLVNPRSALDIGTGTGIWAVDFGKLFRFPFTPNNSFAFLLALLLLFLITLTATQYPSTDVMGTDLSPIQPQL